jgi:hypothetical protein
MGGQSPLSAPKSQAPPGVKAKPYGRPPAGLDPGSHHHLQRSHTTPNEKVPPSP